MNIEKSMKTVRLLLFVATALAASSVHAVPANGSFSVSQFGTVTAAFSGPWAIGLLTTSITVPNTFGNLLVSSIVDPYLGSPNNLSLANAGTVTSFPTCAPFLTGCAVDIGGASTFTFGVTTGAITPFTVVVGSYTFQFTDEVITTFQNGNVALGFVGTLFADADPTPLDLGTPVSFSANFSQITQGGAISASYGLAAPSVITLPGGSSPVPEPEMLGLLGIGLAGFGVIARRRVRGKFDKKLA